MLEILLSCNWPSVSQKCLESMNCHLTNDISVLMSPDSPEYDCVAVGGIALNCKHHVIHA